MSSPPRKTPSPRALLLLALISMLVLPALCFYPFHADHSILQSMGLELYRYHGLPYLGSWDNNFPGTVLIHALGIALFGNSMLGFRGIELVIQIAIVCSLYALSRLWLSESASIVGCFLYALFYIHGPGQFMGQRDDFAVLPLAWAFEAVILAYRGKSPRSQTVLLATAGAMFALATSIRPTLIFLLIVPFITLFKLREARGRTLLLLELLGFIAIVLLWLLPYALSPDGIRQLYLSIISFNVKVYSQTTFHFHDVSNRLLVVVAFLLWWGGVMILHRRSGLHFSEAPRSKEETRFIFWSLAALLFGAIAMRKIASYHLMPFCAFFFPVLGVALWDVKMRWGKRGTIAVAALLVVLFAGLYPWKIVFSKQGETILFSSKPLAERLTGDSLESEVVSYIRHNTNDRDTVEVSAFFPDIRWQIELPSATRFTTPTPLLLRPAHGTFTDFQKEWQAEYVTAIERIRPKFYIVQNAVDSASDVVTLRDLLAFPGFAAFVHQAYTLDTTMKEYYIYRRK
jgi:4-amino-4-deoxy-L-arabinose transferase-like glycosyltransferase